jgi:hypothetical protein
VLHYTQEEIKTKCRHPVCKNCYFQLIKQECPICGMHISSLFLDIQKAIFNIINVRYEKLYGDIDYINILFDYFDDDYALIIIKDDNYFEYYYKNSKKEIIDQYYYLHSKHIEKDIKIEQKVCECICE